VSLRSTDRTRKLVGRQLLGPNPSAHMETTKRCSYKGVQEVSTACQLSVRIADSGLHAFAGAYYRGWPAAEEVNVLASPARPAGPRRRRSPASSAQTIAIRWGRMPFPPIVQGEPARGKPHKCGFDPTPHSLDRQHRAFP
jgi:hypothetical protein